MEQSNTQQTPQGKGMGVAGFVLPLVALALLIFIVPAALVAAALGGGTGLSIFWLVLSLTGTVLSIMGMMKLGKTGGKKGLATTGMILGIIALLTSAWLVFAVGQVHDKAGDLGGKFKSAFEKELNKGMDSLSREAAKKLDSAAQH